MLRYDTLNKAVKVLDVIPLNLISPLSVKLFLEGSQQITFKCLAINTRWFPYDFYRAKFFMPL